MHPLISVIVPIYNVEAYLMNCIQSICNQTYNNLEIILVDDESPDKCPAICDELAISDSRIKVIHQKNTGQATARNNGLLIAKGEMVAFVDSDDYLHPEMYEKMYKQMVKDNSELAICGVQYVEQNGSKINDTINVTDGVWDENRYWDEMYGNINYTYCVALWNKLYKRRLFKNVSFSDGKISEDEALAHKIVQQINKISCISDKMYFYLQRSDSEMGRKFNIKLLDTVDAVSERSIYFIERGWTNKAELAFTYGIASFLKCIDKPEMKEKLNKSIYKACKKRYRCDFFYLWNKGVSWKFKANIISFLINEKLYLMSRRLKIN